MRVLLLLLAIVQHAPCEAPTNSSESTSAENTTTQRNLSGKTYFIQLKKSASHDENEKASYIKINHYKNPVDDGREEVKEDEFIRRKYHELFAAPEDLREATASSSEEQHLLDKRQNPNRIDEEWCIIANRTVYDLPNITAEIYEAMLAEHSNKHQQQQQQHAAHNHPTNASMVKFFFEHDTNHTSNIVRFNLDSLTNTSEVIVDAELHVYRLPRQESNKTRTNTTDNVVRLYQMLDDHINTGNKTNNTTQRPSVSSSSSSPDIHKLANVIYISASYSGWQVFKVKSVVDNWRNGDENLGFLIATADAHDRLDAGVEFAHRERNGGSYQPVLVVYMHTPHARRTAGGGRMRKPLKQTMRRTNAQHAANPCRRHVWYVSFHELGWNNFVLAPSGFMAHRCTGSCVSPTANAFTNHGKLLAIMQAQHAQQPCCAPSSYKSQLIMFYDRENNVVIKEYDEMIVNSCGCR